MDCILGYHMNPLACGVAKFNLILARKVGVPVLQVFDPTASHYKRPLLSFKISEFNDEDIIGLARLLKTARWRSSYTLFFHAWSGTEIERQLVEQAEAVYCGNSELTSQIQGVRKSLIEVWCPGTLLETQRFNNPEITVFSFGMAHKIRSDMYRKLQRLLEQTQKSYGIYLSTALHENTTIDGSFTVVFEELRDIFGENIYFLGYLSDTTCYNYLLDTTFFAAFFEGGVRANNTTVNAAMQCGAVVITNLDKYSPRSYRHSENMLDIVQCHSLPTDPGELSKIRKEAEKAAAFFGWDNLVSTMSRKKNVHE